MHDERQSNFKEHPGLILLKKVMMVLLEMLKKATSKDDNIFFSALANIGCCIRRIKDYHIEFN